MNKTETEFILADTKPVLDGTVRPGFGHFTAARSSYSRAATFTSGSRYD